MRAADLRTGITRVATLGRRVLPGTENSSTGERPIASRWLLLFAAGICLTLLLMGAWYAGRESSGLEAQRLSLSLNRLAQQVDSNQLALKQQTARTEQLQRALNASGKTNAVTLQVQLRKQLLAAQAEANEYKEIMGREREAAQQSARVIDALSSPGAHLMPFKAGEAAADSTAYALLINTSRLLFVASNLPHLESGRQFQLWIVRKADPKFVSAGVFTPDGNSRAVMSVNDASILSEISEVEVTDEPDGGSSAPTGTKLLETSVTESKNSNGGTVESGDISAADPQAGSSHRSVRPDTSR